ADEPALPHGRLAHLRAHDQIHGPATIARLHVLESVPLLRQGPDGLGEEGPLAHGHRELARARTEELAGGADEVAHVEIDEGRVAIAQGVLPRVELDLARLVPQMGEAGLTVMTEGHDP